MKVSVNETQTNLKEAQVTTIYAIDEMAQASPNSKTANRKEPYIPGCTNYFAGDLTQVYRATKKYTYFNHTKF